MSMNRLAIVAAIGTHNSMKNRTDDIRLNKHPSIEKQERPNGPAFEGDVNILLGGAMLSIVISIVCFVCYCCHRNLKHRDVIYRQRWLQVDPNMDIYSVEQYYDITANNRMNDDQYTQVMKTHGPPPSYEIAVSMKNPIALEKCNLCENKIRLTCSCDSNILKGDEDDMIHKSDQFLNVKNISHHEFCCGSESTYKNQQCITKICPMCDEEVNCKNNNITNEDIQNGNSGDGYCQCSNYNICKNLSNTGLLRTNVDSERFNTGTIYGRDINANMPSTSGDATCSQNCDLNCNYEESDDDIDNEDNEFDSLNENGLIRVDMTKIIDQTGLPTYEAALKLEATGYV